MNSPNSIYTLHRGTLPLLVSVPHAGREISPEVRAQLLPRALEVEDTDWHLERLYDFVRARGASLIVPRQSRYVVDLNRPSDNQPMYPGVNNTELCPTRHFTGHPIYPEGGAPDDAEVQRRVALYWQPYHRAIDAELARLKAAHGHAILFDGHSIKSELPWLFDGRLPDLNFGTVDGGSCAVSLRDALAAVLDAQQDFSHIVDGRFKGGQITRHYGAPARGIHAVQMEMCWSAYLGDEAHPEVWSDERAAKAQALLARLVDTMLDWRP